MTGMRGRGAEDLYMYEVPENDRQMLRLASHHWPSWKWTRSTLSHTVAWRTWKHSFCYSKSLQRFLSGEPGSGNANSGRTRNVAALVWLASRFCWEINPFLVSSLPAKPKDWAYHFWHCSKFGHGSDAIRWIAQSQTLPGLIWRKLAKVLDWERIPSPHRAQVILHVIDMSASEGHEPLWRLCSKLIKRA